MTTIKPTIQKNNSRSLHHVKMLFRLNHKSPSSLFIAILMSLALFNSMYLDNVSAKDGYSKDEIDLFIEWALDEHNNLSHVHNIAYKQQGSIFLGIINSNKILSNIDKGVSLLHYHVAGLPVQFIKLDELSGESILDNIKRIEIGNKKYSVYPFYIFSDRKWDDYDNIIDHNFDQFGLSRHVISEDEYNLSNECEIKRYRREYNIYQTLAFPKPELSESRKVACFFTGAYVALGLSNANTIFNSPYLMSRIGESGYAPGKGFHPLNMLYKGLEGSGLQPGSTREDIVLELTTP